MKTIRLSAALSAVLALAGCGAVTPVATEPASELIPVHVYWAVAEPTSIRLIGEDILVPADVAGAEELVSALVSGEVNPLDDDYTNLWANGTSVTSIVIDGDVATVDLSLAPLNVGAEAESIAIQQLVWTLTDADPSIVRVLITVDGAPVESLAGHVDASAPFSRGTKCDTLAPLTIADMRDGIELRVPFEIHGFACTPDGAVSWKIEQNGEAVIAGETTADDVYPIWSPWRADVTELEPGEYTLVVQNINPNSGEVLAEDNKEFVAR